MSVKPILTGAICFAAGILCFAAFRDLRDSRALAEGQPDPAKFERFLRRYYAWPAATVEVKVGPFKAGPMAGFVESKVTAGAKNSKAEPLSRDFLISNDGRFMLENAPLRIDGDPFQETREQIDIRNQPTFGSALPRVTIVEYGDLQCSYCKTVVSVLRNDIPRDYGREVRIIFKDFPLYEIHPWAWDAAAAGRCIYKQKAETFWEYHDWAYDQQGRMNQEQFKKAAIAFAGTRKLDIGKMVSCMADPSTRAEVERSLQEGRALHVTGTPVFFINGRFVEGSQSYGAMRQYIEAELEFLASRNDAAK